MTSQYTRYTEGVFGSDVRTPSPVAVLVAEILQWLAWEDVDVRPVADYFRFAGLLGSGGGVAIKWPLSVFSTQVQLKLRSHPPTSGVEALWDRWSLVV